MKIQGFRNADWAGYLNDRKSTARYCTFIGGGNLVYCLCKKQMVVARSSVEAEDRAMVLGFVNAHSSKSS